MMTPEQKFARWVRVSIAAFLVIFAWFIVADIWIPLTPDSTVMRVVTPVSSRVSGYVSQVHVHNNSQVKKGDLLYELDPTPFINKVEAAQIALEQAKLSNQQLDAQIASARANLRTAQFNARNDKTTFDRYQRLSAMQNVSQADLDKVRTAWQTSEQSLVSHQTDIVADFREKSLRHTRVDTDAAVVFDAMPGKVFSARVTSSDAGILAGQEQVNGQLSQPEQSTRWVRDAQRMRIHVALNEPLDTPLPTGARATVQLYNSEGMFARTFAGAQIHLVSWLHYVY